MAEKTLNRRRDHGVVYGHQQAAYEQDGRLYAHDGSLIEPPSEQQQQSDPDAGDPGDVNARDPSDPTPARRSARARNA
jgi:hypothetical protein